MLHTICDIHNTAGRPWRGRDTPHSTNITRFRPREGFGGAGCGAKKAQNPSVGVSFPENRSLWPLLANPTQEKKNSHSLPTKSLTKGKTSIIFFNRTILLLIIGTRAD